MTFNLAEPSRIDINGFSLFEFLIVVLIVSFLMYLSFPYYFNTIDKSRTNALMFQATTFARTVENLYGQAKLHGRNFVNLNDVTIYMNDKGWPASTSNKTSLKHYNQSPQECDLLWKGLFKSPPKTVIVNEKKQTKSYKSSGFGVFSISGRICRYELLSIEEGSYFFDYDLKTGEVKIHSP